MFGRDLALLTSQRSTMVIEMRSALLWLDACTAPIARAMPNRAGSVLQARIGGSSPVGETGLQPRFRRVTRKLAC